MDDYRKELLDKADEIGLEYPKNIATDKLETLILEQEEALETASPAVQKPPQSAMATPAVQPAQYIAANPMTEQRKKQQALRKRIVKAKQKALKTKVVTLTNQDQRENDVMTTAHLSFENQYFAVSKIVPLNVPVELEQALIDIAKSARITMHKDEIINGKRTGNKTSVSVAKFAISYGENQPS